MRWLRHVISAENTGPSPPAGASGAPGTAERSRPSGTAPLVSITPRITSSSGAVEVGAASCGDVVGVVVATASCGDVVVVDPTVVGVAISGAAVVVVAATITGVALVVVVVVRATMTGGTLVEVVAVPDLVGVANRGTGCAVTVAATVSTPAAVPTATASVNSRRIMVARCHFRR